MINVCITCFMIYFLWLRLSQDMTAFHDGYIELTYLDVKSYNLSSKHVQFNRVDWLYDEVRLSDNGNVLHEIEWDGGDYWVIEATEIIYKWSSFSDVNAA